ncbi:hypothetical protein [Nitrosopumilus sp. Nsub]|uniref:hypothetical protein n=1 Tax=Nitrosopumilus sp. Nsub TaxID=1776294 RepID=UPI0008306441|nr:hypothetical protein [Nitrosopumilus sp. Nsub]
MIFLGNWKLDFEDGYYRIFDSSKLITGYFDPDYGDLSLSKNPDDVILSKIQNHEKISGGMIMIPLVKFRLFDTDLNTTLSNVQQNVSRVSTHLQKWDSLLSKINNSSHFIGISHTDQDMLTITFPVKFSEPTPLDTSYLIKEISPTLDLLETCELL